MTNGQCVYTGDRCEVRNRVITVYNVKENTITLVKYNFCPAYILNRLYTPAIFKIMEIRKFIFS